MAFDFKKEYKEFYIPKSKPSIVTIPSMNYIAVRGEGNPNDESGEYTDSIALLYAIAYTIKMSHKRDHKIEGFFDYVPRWKASGGRMVIMPSTMPIKKTFSLFPSFVCRIL